MRNINYTVFKVSEVDIEIRIDERGHKRVWTSAYVKLLHEPQDKVLPQNHIETYSIRFCRNQITGSIMHLECFGVVGEKTEYTASPEKVIEIMNQWLDT